MEDYSLLVARTYFLIRYNGGNLHCAKSHKTHKQNCVANCKVS